MYRSLSVALLLCALSLSLASAALPTENLSLYYKFENNLDNQVGQSSGTLAGNAIFSSGQSGQAIEFNGSSGSYVDIGEGDGITENVSAFSTSSWIYKRAADTSRAGPIRQLNVFAIHSGPNRVWQFTVRNASGHYTTAQANAGLVSNKWTHLAGVYNGSHLLLYVDGVLQNSRPLLFGEIATHSNNIEIGRDFSYSATLNGLVDETMLYAKALNQSEIADIIQAQNLSLSCSNDPGCLAEGSFCGIDAPYTCALGSEGCFVRTNLTACDSGYLCQSGQCIADPCFGIAACADYSDSSSCNFNTCSVAGFCSWNTTSTMCEVPVLNTNFSVPTNGLVAYYGFENESYDEVSHTPGTILGNVSFSSGKVNLAANFNGAYGSTIDFGEGEGVSENITGITVSAWVYKKASDSARAGPIRQANVFGIQTNPSRMWQFTVRNASGQSATATANSALISDAWTHLAGVYNGSNLKLYVNGVLQNSQPSLFGRTAAHANNIEIARDYAYATSLNGSVDEVMIYNRSLTGEEITQIKDAQEANTPLCEFGEIYVGGSCIVDNCLGVSMCGDYSSSLSCSANLCGVNSLCSWNATNNVCLAQTCSDGIQNQNETGIDCGGVCLSGGEICGNGFDDNRNCVADFEEPICQITNTSWSFVLMSDTYGGLHNSLYQAYSWALANNADIKFMIEAGDFENEQVIDNLIQQLQPTYFPSMSYAPWFAAAGNHNADESIDMDFISDTLAPRLATQLPGMTAFKSGLYNDSSMYGRRNTTYSFDYRDAHFVILNQYYNTYNDLDGHPLACINQDLYNWLEEDLENTTQPFIFVVGHEPAWPNGNRHCGDSLDDFRCDGNYINWTDPSRPSRDRFWELLKQHNVTAHLVGHEHAFSARVINTLDDFPGIQCDGNACHCDQPHWNCYCNVEQGLANVPNNATIMPGNGILEYNNGITRDGGHFHVIRVDGDKVEFNAYRNVNASIYELVKKITYELN